MVGNRKLQTLSARIKSENCNFLNAYKPRHTLKPGVNVLETSCAVCGELEDDEHFVMNCKRFSALREIMFENICSQIDINECDISYGTIIGGG